MIKQIKAYRQKIKITIDWKSKLIDFFIVILGISLAFQLNSWNESRKDKQRLSNYLESFRLETQENVENLQRVLNAVRSQREVADTIKVLIASKRFMDPRLGSTSPEMTSFIAYQPLATTIENIKESGDFDLIKNYTLRKQLVDTYESMEGTEITERATEEYIRNFISPYFFNKVRYSTNYPIDPEDFITDHRFENIAIAYSNLMTNQIIRYEGVLEKLQDLEKSLDSIE
ncbi:hypothetical protein [Tunicatimonas pelagia]|uniref:hypothetical protein n=1 Tax=Tunicatimonas pelagia TaxID=931531 RepID=UPI002666B03E|nr:hypothetical protein [Tunicatimonas pelagia]WKN46244.1 hypothetical protein P0M28_14930 [Tunicatimonas pelagia]